MAVAGLDRVAAVLRPAGTVAAQRGPAREQVVTHAVAYRRRCSGGGVCTGGVVAGALQGAGGALTRSDVIVQPLSDGVLVAV